MQIVMSRSRDLLATLIAFPTVSRDSNLALVDFVAGFLTSLGADVRLVPSEDGRKANLHATFGPADRPGVMLSGHTDVVPVDGQDWASDPFTLTEAADGRLVGRGTADMKGFIAATLALAEKAATAPLRVPLHLAFSYDEEVGCLGVRRMLDMLAPMAVKPRFCIIGEPTSMGVAIAHKGKAALRIACRGAEVHSSLAPEGVNAIHLASDMIQGLRALQDDLARAGARDEDYGVAYSTIHVGTIRGGTALNIVAGDCVIDAEIRHLPQEPLAPLLARIEAVAAEVGAAARAAHPDHPEIGVEVTVTSSYPALDTAPDAEVVAFVKQLTGGNSHGKISFGTEGGLFQERLGLPTVVCGPGRIDDAHKPNESLDPAQLAACDRFLDALLEALCR